MSKGKFDRFICLRLEYSIGSLGLARCNETLPILGNKGREIRCRLIIPLERNRDNIHFFCFFLFFFGRFVCTFVVSFCVRVYSAPRY